MTDELLARIAAALERIAPQSPAQASLAAHPAYVWDGLAARPVKAFAPAQDASLTGIDEQKGLRVEHTRRQAAGVRVRSTFARERGSPRTRRCR